MKTEEKMGKFRFLSGSFTCIHLLPLFPSAWSTQTWPLYTCQSWPSYHSGLSLVSNCTWMFCLYTSPAYHTWVYILNRPGQAIIEFGDWVCKCIWIVYTDVVNETVLTKLSMSSVIGCSNTSNHLLAQTLIISTPLNEQYLLLNHLRTKIISNP